MKYENCAHIGKANYNTLCYDVVRLETEKVRVAFKVFDDFQNVLLTY